MRSTTCLMLATLVSGSVLSGGLAAQGEILEQILVKVNGEILTKTDLEERQVAYLRQRGQPLTDEELRKVLAEVTPQLVADAIDELLLVQRGRELGYRLTDEQFTEILERIKKENDLESEEKFQAALKQEGLTLADLRRSLERQALISRVQQVEVMGGFSITDLEARQYYDQHLDEFRTPASVTLREVLVEVPADEKGVNVAADEAAREQAERARARVLAGEDFAVVAGEVSQAPSKANGGLLGPVRVDELAPAIAELVTKLKVGEVSPVFRTARGYQFLKLENLTPAAVRPFDEVRDEVANRMWEERRRVELRKYLRKLRAQAIIEWKNDELRKAYEQYLAKSEPSAA